MFYQIRTSCIYVFSIGNHWPQSCNFRYLVSYLKSPGRCWHLDDLSTEHFAHMIVIAASVSQVMSSDLHNPCILHA